MLGLDPALLLYRAVAFIVAATIHEYAHAYVADRLGDPTPRNQGRLTLNPVAHLDLLGTLLVLVAGFGWAKPVMLNPMNFRDWRRDTMMVAAAGPLANITLLFGLGVPYKLGIVNFGGTAADDLLLTVIGINAMLAVFNLIPLPPLDGSKILMGLLPPAQAVSYARVQPYGMVILLLLVLTNVLSIFLIPPIRWLVAQATGSGFF